ncbi:MAG: ribosomal protein S18-alanine N-acetyltransferase [Clostridia bacterium]
MKNKLDDFYIYPFEPSYVDGVKEIENEQNISILSKKSILEDLDDENCKYFIATLDEKLVGYIGACYCLDYMDLLSIVVKKDYQNMGIGSKLLNHIFAFAKDNKIEKIFIEVRKSNEIAQKFYLSHGFKNINIRKKYYSDNFEDALIYEKDMKKI